jgi:hypothetical protein
MTQGAKAHATPGGVAHLAVLHVKSSVRKQVEIAGVIVMQVGHDDILDCLGGNPESHQRLHRIERELAASQARLDRVEAGVDQNMAAASPDQPHKVIEVGRRSLVRVG